MCKACIQTWKCCEDEETELFEFCNNIKCRAMEHVLVQSEGPCLDCTRKTSEQVEETSLDVAWLNIHTVYQFKHRELKKIGIRRTSWENKLAMRRSGGPRPRKRGGRGWRYRLRRTDWISLRTGDWRIALMLKDLRIRYASLVDRSDRSWCSEAERKTIKVDQALRLV